MTEQAETKKINPFIQKKEEITSSKRWAEIKDEISKENIFQKESFFKSERQPERETFFMRTTFSKMPKKRTSPPPNLIWKQCRKIFLRLKRAKNKLE